MLLACSIYASILMSLLVHVVELYQAVLFVLNLIIYFSYAANLNGSC